MDLDTVRCHAGQRIEFGCLDLLFPLLGPLQTIADKGRRDWIDVDKLNEDDPQACSTYAQPIFQYLREAELTKRASPKYLEQVQSDVNAKMRAILVDWLVEVSEEYKLCADTLYQAVNYIDRFLTLQSTQRSQLQLIGVTCMWVAAKYEEIYPPNVAGEDRDFHFCTWPVVADLTYRFIVIGFQTFATSRTILIRRSR